MRVLVTGGAGFIGSVISESLLDQGHEVFVIDDLRYGHRSAVPNHAEFERIDITDFADVKSVFRRWSFDAVVHLAAEAAVNESVKDPGKFYSVNVHGGINLLEAMRFSGVHRFIFSSTAAVFGEPECIPIDENARKQPVNAYGETKLAFERALACYEKSFGIRHVSFRYFNACGATSRRGEDRTVETHLIPILLQVVQGRRRDITLFGTDYPTADGTCVRDYVHVADIAQAHILGLNMIDQLKENAFNLGSGIGNSNMQVIEAAREVTGHPIPVSVGERRPGDPAILVATAAKAKLVLGWKPKHVELREMVQSAWNWRQANPDGYAK